ncbi:response regulator transcription factor [Pelagibius sp. Alg239-R121]|uniref:response regulator transcription factor n=1 Tax=Pelagibius sp. Alg239-R121 TaxID=2993448 RepID=UPI0024A67BC9|nr:response regulator transcription factor [Pelagibius sp. Alg239-R121]
MRIVVIEDNLALAKAVATSLMDEGHGVDVIDNGSEASLFLSQEQLDLVILDINLPGKSGIDVLAEFRAGGASTPVILLTARSDTKDRVAGLDKGADDYLVKPFDMAELLARVRALLRRSSLEQTLETRVGDLVFDQVGRRVYQAGAPLDLPRREFALLELFAGRVGQVISKEQILDHLYGTGSDSDAAAAELYVHRLRKRLVDCGLTIKTFRGLGYCMEENP